MKTRLGRQETLLPAYVHMRKLRVVRTGELLGPLRLSRDQERELFRRLARGRLIARVRPGLYLVPPELPFGGSWTPNEEPRASQSSISTDSILDSSKRVLVQSTLAKTIRRSEADVRSVPAQLPSDT